MDRLLREHPLVMASIAHLRLAGSEELCGVRRVWVVATSATRAEGGMDIFLGEHGLVMAGVAHDRLAGSEELCSVRRVGIMAAGASHADGGMDRLLAEHRRRKARWFLPVSPGVNGPFGAWRPSPRLTQGGGSGRGTEALVAARGGGRRPEPCPGLCYPPPLEAVSKSPNCHSETQLDHSQPATLGRIRSQNRETDPFGFASG